MVKRVVGIDPGQTGAVCVLDEFGGMFVDWAGDPWGMAARLAEAIPPGIDTVAALERVHAMPKQGVSSTFKFGRNYGFWEGWLSARGIPCESPTPQTWQKGLVFPSDGADPKARALAVARRLYPGFAGMLVTPRGRILDGRVDALLIAHWLRRELGCAW